MPTTTTTVSDRTLRVRLLTFLVVCFGLSWIPWIALGVLGADVDEGPALIIFGLAASAPSLAALVMWLFHRREGTRARVRASWVWPVASILLGAAAPLLTAVLWNAGDLGAIPAHALATAASVGGPLGALAYTLVSGPLAEEFGWRGYVQPRLRTRLGRIATSIVLGAVWTVWHLPLFFLEGTGQHETGLFTVDGLLFALTLIPLSFIMLFAFERLQGGVWSAILIHAAYNASDALTPPTGTAGEFVQTLLVFVFAGLGGLVWARSDSRAAHDPADESETTSRA